MELEPEEAVIIMVETCKPIRRSTTEFPNSLTMNITAKHTHNSNLNIYRNVCQLRPMNVVAKVRFKLL